MPIDEEALLAAKAALRTPLEKIASEQLEKRGGLSALRLAVEDLEGLAKNEIKPLASKLSALVQAVLDGPIYRRLFSSEAQLTVVLFGATDAATKDFLHDIEIYRQQLHGLLNFIKTPEFDKLIANRNQFHNFENLAAVLFDRQSGLIDRYINLTAETQPYNALVQRLFPEQFSDLLIEDHHIIEKRVYPKFQKTWQLIGWNSTDDIAAIPLMKEFHTGSPKDFLPKIRSSLFEKGDVTTLTGQLQRAVKIDQINTVDQLLNAYEDFYRSQSKIRDQTLPVLKEVRRQISIKQTLKGLRTK